MTMIFNFEKRIDSLSEKVIAQVKAKVSEYFQFDILKHQYIEKLWEAKGIIEEAYVIYISESNLAAIDFSSSTNSKGFIEEAIEKLKSDNIIGINNKLEIIESHKICNGIIKYCCDLSKSESCFFLLSRNGIKVIINGEIVLENSLFIDEQDCLDYAKKLDISQIKDVLLKYQDQLIGENINLFFENNDNINSINDLSGYKNILKFKPEKFMKEHMRDFLNKNIRRTFNMNYVLSNSGREIDIYAEDKDFYFITIKWLGVSVNEYGSKLNPPNTDYDVRAGVTQTLEYIRELREVEGFTEKTLKIGYLIVFDARDQKKSIQLNLDSIDDELMKYKDHFDIISEFKIDKKNSA